jgi:hypothetical protein
MYLTGGALSGLQAGPLHAHFRAMLDAMKYVGATAVRRLTHGTSTNAVSCWCDSNFAAKCVDTGRSTTGYVATMYGGAVSWTSQKQATIANLIYGR